MEELKNKFLQMFGETSQNKVSLSAAKKKKKRKKRKKKSLYTLPNLHSPEIYD